MANDAKDIDIGIRTRFWELMKANLESQLDRKRAMLMKGQAGSYADYRELVGSIQGLEYALELPDKMLADEQER